MVYFSIVDSVSSVRSDSFVVVSSLSRLSPEKKKEALFEAAKTGIVKNESFKQNQFLAQCTDKNYAIPYILRKCVAIRLQLVEVEWKEEIFCLTKQNSVRTAL